MSTELTKEQQNQLIITALAEIKQQNNEMLEKIDHANKETVRTAIKTAAVTGAASGGIVAVGIEFIRLKLGL